MVRCFVKVCKKYLKVIARKKVILLGEEGSVFEVLVEEGNWNMRKSLNTWDIQMLLNVLEMEWRMLGVCNLSVQGHCCLRLWLGMYFCMEGKGDVECFISYFDIFGELLFDTT